MKYFLKEIFQNGLLDLTGKPFPFEPIGGNNGLAAIDETTPEGANLVFQLEDLHKRRVGGIVPMTEGEYSAKKAGYPLLPSAPMFTPLRVLQVQRPQIGQKNAPVVEGDGKPVSPWTPGQAPPGHTVPTAPPPVPPVEFKPRRGKIPTNMAEKNELLAKTAKETVPVQ